MVPELAALSEKYKYEFSFREYPNHWLQISSRFSVHEDFAGIEGPHFLTYLIKEDDEDPDGLLGQRSREVWLVDGKGDVVQGLCYKDRMGVYQVVIPSGESIDFGDLDPLSRDQVLKFLESIDHYVFDSIPELRRFLGKEEEQGTERCADPHPRVYLQGNIGTQRLDGDDDIMALAE